MCVCVYMRKIRLDHIGARALLCPRVISEDSVIPACDMRVYEKLTM